ncbi:Nucleotidyl transferase AbiEii/AbiGii toxin family protein [Pararobbsia alpina]|uniref:nucleotidyl transferase AbiEii/AbiGii toxin family protein n=1 Tax=Pararobbsia alpina TaxID=621374 RepID=UPI0039A4F8A2
MTFRSIKNTAASVRARLLEHAKQNDDDYQRILTRYAIERLLFRLSKTESADRYVLKGAMLFLTWTQNAFRPTNDLDLLGHDSPEPVEIALLFTRICQVEAFDDGITFDVSSLKVTPVREANKYQGVQVTVKAILADARIHVQVDIGFGDHVHPLPARRYFPSLLADMPSAIVLMYPPETVVAEKFEAMIRFGEHNGRVKDFHDIWVIARTFPFELGTLLQAVRGTLTRRETAMPQEMPVGLNHAFAAIVEQRGLWSGFLRRSPPTMLPPPFSELLADLRRFLGPVIAKLQQADPEQRRWDPNRQAWI